MLQKTWKQVHLQKVSYSKLAAKIIAHKTLQKTCQKQYSGFKVVLENLKNLENWSEFLKVRGKVRANEKNVE